MTEVKWALRKRLEQLESELFWGGRVNRSLLMNKTEVSPAQASLDLSSYKELADRNMIYSLSDKAYHPSPEFNPVFISTDPQDFLAGQKGDCAEAIPLPYRHIDPNYLKIIYRAVKEGSWVTIDYTSLSPNKNISRTIAPHSFLFDGLRWHVRAYDFSSLQFRDFVLGRIQFAVDTTPVEANGGHKWKSKHDHDWNTWMDVTLIPHPELGEDQRQAICLDYQMDAGEFVVSIRKACVFYLVKRFRLLSESDRPEEQQIVLKDPDSVKRALGQQTG